MAIQYDRFVVLGIGCLGPMAAELVRRARSKQPLFAKKFVIPLLARYLFFLLFGYLLIGWLRGRGV